MHCSLEKDLLDLNFEPFGEGKEIYKPPNFGFHVLGAYTFKLHMDGGVKSLNCLDYDSLMKIPLMPDQKGSRLLLDVCFPETL